MKTSPKQFAAVFDAAKVPLLNAGSDLPCSHLSGCESLTFFHTENPSAIIRIILEDGTDWHLYGDTRWPSVSSWLEIDTTCAGFPGYSGTLVVTYQIPDGQADAFAWIAQHGPLQRLFPEGRGKEAVEQRLKMLHQQAAATDEVT